MIENRVNIDLVYFVSPIIVLIKLYLGILIADN
jgi:hypothetical protein